MQSASYSLIYSSSLPVCAKRGKECSHAFLWKSRYGRWPMNFEKEVNYVHVSSAAIFRKRKMLTCWVRALKKWQFFPLHALLTFSGRLLNLLLSCGVCQVQNISSRFEQYVCDIKISYGCVHSAICLLLANDDCVRGLVLMQLSHLERSDGCIAKAIAVRQHRPFSQVIHRRSTAFCHLLGNLLIRLFYIMHFHDENFHLSSQHTKIYSNHSLFSFYASLNCSK